MSGQGEGEGTITGNENPNTGGQEQNNVGDLLSGKQTEAPPPDSAIKTEDFGTLFSNGENFANNWNQSLSKLIAESDPEFAKELHDNKGMATVTTLTGLAKKAIGGEKKIGELTSNANIALTPESDEETRAKAYLALGKPETVEGYTLKADENSPLDSEVIDGFKAFAHENNFTDSQVTGAVNWFVEKVEAPREAARLEAARQEHTDTVTRLNEVHGDQANGLVQKAVNVAKQFKMHDALVKLGALQNFDVINGLIEMSGAYNEPDITQTMIAQTPATAEAELKKIYDAQRESGKPFTDTQIRHIENLSKIVAKNRQQIMGSY